MIAFISDVHLGYGDIDFQKSTEQYFLTLLQKLEPVCSRLVLMGDIFDYWFEYKTVLPLPFYRTLAELHRLRERGLPIEYIMGNHDFGHSTFFREYLDIHVEKDDITREWNGKKFYLSHGDGKQKNDKGYLLLKSILRNSTAQRLFRFLHPDVGISAAVKSSHSSRKHGAKKFAAKLQAPDAQKEFAFAKIDEGFDFVLMGHRHYPEAIPHGNGLYINTGDIIVHRTFALFDGSNTTLCTTGKNFEILDYQKV